MPMGENGWKKLAKKFGKILGLVTEGNNL